MNWISVKDEKPDEDCLCLVCNCHGYMADQKAMYNRHTKIFRLYDPSRLESLTLDVTHYIIIPDPPEVKE